MKETLSKNDKEIPLFCSICHKKELNLRKNFTIFNTIFKDNLKNNDLSDLIKKCNCKQANRINSSHNNKIYVHKYCILIKIIFNFEIKCEKCNTLYNIKIDKKVDSNKKLYLFGIFIIIYIIHLFIYLFCFFLLFINVILKECINKDYKHLTFFFAIILLIINSFFLYFSITKNIEKKNNIYKYTINIIDSISINDNNCCINAENEFYKLLLEFYQWFYNQSIKSIIIKINKRFINNKFHNDSLNSVQKCINENNIEKIEIKNISSKEKDKIINNNKNDLSQNNLINIEPKNIIQNENDVYSIKSNTIKEEINIIKQETVLKKNLTNNLSSNPINDIEKKNSKDFINININPRTSKNININIHFSSDKNSIFDYSSSKDIINLQSNKKVNKMGKTAFIPKKLTMTNIMSENNAFQRKRRALKSIKIKQNNMYLVGSGLPGNIVEDEEVDFSEFDKIGSKISKESKDKNYFFGKNDLDLRNFRNKKSYKNIDLNVSDSDEKPNEEVIGNNQGVRESIKNKVSNKHVHFNAQGNT